MIYFFTNRKAIKIGYTNESIKERLRRLNSGLNMGEIYYCIGCMEGGEFEKNELHKKFLQYRLRGFTELFSPADEIINYINDNSQMKDIFVEYNKEEELVYFYGMM